MGESAQKLLEIKNLSKNFGGINAVEDFSMSMEKGELHCLIGPNGAGKTTVFKMITGILPVSSGKIVLEGQDITKEATVKELKEESALKCRYLGCLET